MHDASVKCFGVGDGWPSADRYHSSFLYRLGDSAILIDCGEPVSRSFKASGLSYDLIDHLFLSHLHFDHFGGFFMLLQSFWLEGRTKDLPVHLPADGIMPVRTTLDAACIFDELLPFKLKLQPLVASGVVTTPAVRVTAYPTTHLADLQSAFQDKHRQQFAAFCFLIESDHLRIAHSADVGAPEDLAPLLEKPIDLLVCELAHVEPEKLFAYLRGREIPRILFVHLGRECRARLKGLQALAHEVLGTADISFPQDGDEFAI